MAPKTYTRSWQRISIDVMLTITFLMAAVLVAAIQALTHE